MHDPVLVQEVQALRHRQRHVLTASPPIELVGSCQRVPAQRLVQIAALRCRGPASADDPHLQPGPRSPTLTRPLTLPLTPMPGMPGRHAVTPRHVPTP